jgi:hypothetical protein
MQEQRHQLERFEAFWREGAASNVSEYFPMEMPAGEWDEQFRAWEGI